MEHALELMPEIVGDESVGIKYAINGLLSLTPDGLPILGETPEVKGLWSAAAVWVKEGPGVGRALAEWMVEGEPEIDLQASDVARFYEHQKSVAHVKARASEGFNKTYGIVHPGEQWESNRDVRLSPFHERERELGAVFYEAAGWERPHWYESNGRLVEEYGVDGREAEWDSRWWSPIINAEHLAMRDRAAMFDLTAFCVFDVVGPGALECVQRVSMRQMDVKLGSVVYTPVLTPRGGFRSDLTIMRLGRRALPGGHRRRARDGRPQVVRRPPARGRHAQVFDLTSSWCTLGLWGPRARDILASTTSDDVSHEGFPFATCRTIEMGSLRVLASRISYVGDLGWELYVPIEQGARLWDMVWEAGEPHGVVPAGIGVYGTTGRLEKCYRAFGFELDGEYDVVEAGMAWGKVKEQDFVGKEAHVRHREAGPGRGACARSPSTTTASSGGAKRYMLGGEPILTRDGDAAHRRQGPPLVRDQRRRRAVGRQAPPDVLPAARARRGGRGAGGAVHGRALSR